MGLRQHSSGIRSGRVLTNCNSSQYGAGCLRVRVEVHQQHWKQSGELVCRGCQFALRKKRDDVAGEQTLAYWLGVIASVAEYAIRMIPWSPALSIVNVYSFISPY